MQDSKQFKTVSQILYWLVENQHEQPGLRRLSEQFGISEFHLQRVFQEFVGVSPKQFLKFLSKEDALSRLRQGQTVLDTSLDIGLSGPGRLHDLLVTTQAVTPGQVRAAGDALHMEYGYGDTPFGEALVAWTNRGVSFLGFCRQQGRIVPLQSLANQWPSVNLFEKPLDATRKLDQIFSGSGQSPVKVWLRGSPFQLKVWEALLRIPSSAHCTYGQIASYLGNPKSSRAVGTAIGRNPVSWLIPCHRVITSMGTLGGYRWGLETKMAMIGVESAKSIHHQDVQSA